MDPPPSAVYVGVPTTTAFGMPAILLFGATPAWNGPHQPIFPVSMSLARLVPVIVTGVPTGPDVGDRLVIVGTGGAVTVNVTPLLICPPLAVTTTGPVVAPIG